MGEQQKCMNSSYRAFQLEEVPTGSTLRVGPTISSITIWYIFKLVDVINDSGQVNEWARECRWREITAHIDSRPQPPHKLEKQQDGSKESKRLSREKVVLGIYYDWHNTGLRRVKPTRTQSQKKILFIRQGNEGMSFSIGKLKSYRFRPVSRWIICDVRLLLLCVNIW